MTPAPIDPLYILQRDLERHKRRAYDALRRLKEANTKRRLAQWEVAELRAVHLGELRYGEI